MAIGDAGDPFGVVTLRDYVDANFDAIRREMALQFNASRVAVEKAEVTTEERLRGMNEFRDALGDQTQTFITRREFESLRDAHELQIRALSRQVYLLVGALAAFQFAIQYLAN